jgi:hypothetical protein
MRARVLMRVLFSKLARIILLSVKDAFRRKQRVRKLISNRFQNFFNARKRGLMVRIGKRSGRDCGQELHVLFAMSASGYTSIAIGVFRNVWYKELTDFLVPLQVVKTESTKLKPVGKVDDNDHRRWENWRNWARDVGRDRNACGW